MSLEKIQANMLPVMEHFYTIQGEGIHSGRAAYFIRLGGCDVGCLFCDVKESWPTESDQWKEVSHIANLVGEAEIVVITGGEPSLYDLHDLTNLLKQSKKQIHLETAGTIALRGTFDWVTLSPKRRKMPEESNWKLANELKVVITRVQDLRWAEQCAQKVEDTCALLLQPEWSVEQEILPTLLTFVKANPQWRISLQTHKYMQIP